MPMFPAILLIVLSGLAGCAGAAPQTPAEGECASRKTLYVVNHGWHTGLVVPYADLAAALAEPLPGGPVGPHVEIGWGDARYYQHPDAGYGLALKALFWPTASVLHVAAFSEPPEAYFDGAGLVAVTVPEAGYDRLMRFVAGSFQAAPRRLGPPLYGAGGFYAANDRFHLLNTCNTWVARALARAGYPISPRFTITVDGLFSQLDPEAATDERCYDVTRIAAAR